MTKPFRLGFMSHLRGRADADQAYSESLRIFETADELGFDAGWVAQHHFKDVDGYLPSPFPFLAAVAARTRRLRVGTSIIVLPFEHPLRVAEDAAVVDTISRGRLELGVGSGSDADEFEAFGVDMDSRHQRTTDCLITLKKALAGQLLGTDGQQLRPPAPTLCDRLWLSALSLRGAQYAAQNGTGLLLSRFIGSEVQAAGQEQEPVAAAYCSAWGERSLPPRVGLSRGIYLGASRRAAQREIEEFSMRAIPADLSTEEFCHRAHIIYGTPDDVAAHLAADRVLPYTTDLILQFDPIHPPLPRILEMLEQVATQVAPALGWQPTAH
ncbi:MAG: LLM class flavin-dependent oxidoreductase [Caldilineaceae bacterium]|nr:LLM class flavin-dependent oxidoreductase [Caldilineaceae bacterium]